VTEGWHAGHGSDGLPLENDADRRASPQLKLHVVESSSSQDAERVGAWTAIVRIVFGTHFLALADQAIVSGTSVLSTVLVGRWAVPSQLGDLHDRTFRIGIGARRPGCAHSASVHDPAAPAVAHTGRTCRNLVASYGISGRRGYGGVGSCGRGNVGARADTNLMLLMCALVLTVQREFGRTYAFAHLQVADALFPDASVAALELGMLARLGRTGRTSAVGACVALGAGCLVASLVWLYREGSNFAIRADQLRQADWRLGKWLCAGQVTVSIQGYASYWMLSLLISMTETGGYAACNSIASLAKPLLAAFRNALTPRAVLAFKEGVSRPPQGQWRRLLRRKTACSIDTTLERLKRESIFPKLLSSLANALARRQ
jgi:hypothetical protein